jgi:hypothetical protein
VRCNRLRYHCSVVYHAYLRVSFHSLRCSYYVLLSSEPNYLVPSSVCLHANNECYVPVFSLVYVVYFCCLVCMLIATGWSPRSPTDCLKLRKVIQIISRMSYDQKREQQENERETEILLQLLSVLQAWVWIQVNSYLSPFLQNCILMATAKSIYFH